MPFDFEDRDDRTDFIERGLAELIAREVSQLIDVLHIGILINGPVFELLRTE